MTRISALEEIVKFGPHETHHFCEVVVLIIELLDLIERVRTLVPGVVAKRADPIHHDAHLEVLLEDSIFLIFRYG